MEPLVAEGIPCVRIYPAEEIVQEQVYHLQILDLSARENQGKLAVIAIHFDYTFDSEQGLFIREWEKMQYQNEFREQVYAAAQRMEAAVFGDGLDHFFILTTRSMLMNAFLKTRNTGSCCASASGRRSSRSGWASASAAPCWWPSPGPPWPSTTR